MQMGGGSANGRARLPPSRAPAEPGLCLYGNAPRRIAGVTTRFTVTGCARGGFPDTGSAGAAPSWSDTRSNLSSILAKTDW